MLRRTVERTPGQHFISRPSLPIVDMGQTSLKSLAQLGLSNFQLLQCMLAFVVLVHAADGAMLPAVFKALEEGLQGATPVSLGVIVLIEALCHSVAVCVWGVMADRGCKLCLLQYAMLLWGFLTLATAFVSSMVSLAVIRALAGIVGAALGPLAQGLVGAVCPPNERGRAFGFLVACAQAGHIIGLMMAGATSHMRIMGGWRGSFFLFSLFTIALAWVLSQVRTEVSQGLFIESRTWQMLSASGSSSDTWTHFCFEVAQNCSLIMARRSFLVLLVQGAFASTTVKAMQYQVMWYEYLGFSDLAASFITSAAPLGCLGGAVASGYLSDWLATRYPNHGRILMGQAADSVKLIVLFLIFTVCGSIDASDEGSMLIMSALSLSFGFFAIMAYAGVVKPLCVEIVPPQLIAQVVGFSAAVDGAMSSFASTPVVGFITEHVFHYKETGLAISEMNESMRQANASALGRAMAAVTITTTLLTVITFGLLHITYPKEREYSSNQLWEQQTEPHGGPQADPEQKEPDSPVLSRSSSSSRKGGRAVSFDPMYGSM
mmetsp:Transcript_27548/g.62689  ORF Transcript_27548/g.62689 Transcript_27548/m.62689 type:complete len:546 (-) Transcript_27548:33-1670(-)